MLRRLFSPVSVLLAVLCLVSVSCDKDKDEEYKTLTLYQSSTKVSIDDSGSSLSLTWEQGDPLGVYNITRGTAQAYSLNAASSSKDTYFSGRIYCDAGDELSVIFPKTAIDTIKGADSYMFSLDLSNQDGSIESIGENIWLQFAKATVTKASSKDNTATGYLTSDFISLLGLVDVDFTYNGRKLTDISRVCFSEIPTEASFDVTQDPSSAEFSIIETKGFIDMTGLQTDHVYIGLFPGKNHTNIYLTAGGELYEGEADITSVFNKSTRQTIDLQRISPTSYIEVGGVRWATGNFIFKDNKWTITDEDSEYITEDQEDYANQSVFNWGVVGEYATSFGNSGDYYMEIASGKQIQGKMFYDYQGNYQEYGYLDAKYGDIVYWATKGKYRMPSYKEVYCIAPLSTEGRKTIEGITATEETLNGVYGYRFKDETTGGSIFLPAVGYRNSFGDRLHEGETGKYFTGKSSTTSKSWVLIFDKDGAVIVNDTYSIYDNVAFKGFGGAIRPVLAQ